MRSKKLLALLLMAAAAAGCGVLENEPKGERVAPPTHPVVSDESRAVQQANQFTAWVRVEGTDKQQHAVVNHVKTVTGEWEKPGELALVGTDHTDEGLARTVAETFALWEDNADRDVRVAVYGEGRVLLYSDGPSAGSAVPTGQTQ
ncbi:hypothetical protein [Streptomyces sp. MUM 178J]|uniref:hypothetical protein n=1 Tax=Streptomyces sp. MUM 178J TaxID=2791991 RepID=UPI002E7B65C0|nr:hypothetical protein [Streptomyces sp. MUM 178J]WRQ79106.1 hypothetical protein I3F59_006795 [Streptomyces sp. MUM 178J]